MSKPNSEIPPSRAVLIWLSAVYLMVFAMVLIGGVTRLTGSGLSMVEWRPLIGWLPPIGDEAWQRVFGIYKHSPQYQQVNSWMTIADFKWIFFWEYVHRLLGRIIGIVVVLPWLILVWRRKLQGAWIWKTGLSFVFGGLQGLLGWFMVKSGLVDVPHVSHYRLAAHLLVAFFVASYVLWLMLDFQTPQPRAGRVKPWTRRAAWLLVGLVVVQTVYGAFMAGMRAGYMYPTFPDMNGLLVPDGLGAMSPLPINLSENPIFVHFFHRILGYLLALAVIVVWSGVRYSERPRQRWAAHILASVAMLQVLLGIATVLLHVSVPVATVHQGMGFMLLSATLFFAHASRAHASRAHAPSTSDVSG